MSDSTDPSTYTPPVDPPDLQLLERSDFVGMNLSQILYGFAIILFFRCMRALLWPEKRSTSTRNPYLAAYTFLLFSFGTVFMAMNMHDARLAYIDDRCFPGGPSSYTLSQYDKPLVIIPNAAFILSNWLADGLLLYRTKIVWGGKYWVLILPVLMYLGSISMGIMTLFQSSQPNATLWTRVTTDFGLPYFSLSASLNILLTLLISLRLYLHHRMMRKSMPSGSSVIPYLTIMGMLIESSALYAVSSILFIGTYGANNNSSLLFLPIVSQTQIIAPLLIIARVADQRAYGSTSATLPSMVYHDSRGVTVTSTSTRTRGDTIQLSNYPGNQSQEKMRNSPV